MNKITMIRAALTVLLCYMVYKETGLFTSLAVLLISLSIEGICHQLREITEAIKSILRSIQ